MLSIFNRYDPAHFSFDELALSGGKHRIRSRHLLAKFQTGFTLQSSHDKKQRITPNFMGLFCERKKNQLDLLSKNTPEMYWIWV